MKGLDTSSLNWCRLYPHVKPNRDKATCLPKEMILVNLCHFLKKKFHYFPIKSDWWERLPEEGKCREPPVSRLIFFWKLHYACRWGLLRLRADLFITVKCNSYGGTHVRIHAHREIILCLIIQVCGHRCVMSTNKHVYEQIFFFKLLLFQAYPHFYKN